MILNIRFNDDAGIERQHPCPFIVLTGIEHRLDVGTSDREVEHEHGDGQGKHQCRRAIAEGDPAEAMGLLM